MHNVAPLHFKSLSFVYKGYNFYLFILFSCHLFQDLAFFGQVFVFTHFVFLGSQRYPIWIMFGGVSGSCSRTSCQLDLLC